MTASRNPTGDVATGTSVSFSATGTDPDGDPLTYAWDFGDGGTGTGANASHAYAATGTYSAKVTVSDGRGGSGQATLSVVVTQGNRAPTVTASRNPDGQRLGRDGRGVQRGRHGRRRRPADLLVELR